MRLIRMRLTDYRGIDDRTIEFGTGTTVIVGENEIGKSCIPEALDLMIQEKATANSATIRSIRPTHTGRPPNVELVIEVGPVTATYAKTWGGGRNAASTTVLTVAGPQGTSSHDGDDAHERFLELLDQHSDLQLLSALTMEQTRAAEQAAVGGSATMQRALAGAIDDAAGPAHGDHSLIDAVRTVAERWLTSGGKPNKDLKTVHERATSAEEAASQAEATLRSVEQDVATHDRLSEAIATLQTSLPQLRADVEEHTATVASLAGLHTAVENAEELFGGARANADRAAEALAARTDLVKQVDELSGEVGRLAEEDARLAESVGDAEEDRTAARADVTEARTERTGARERLGAAQDLARLRSEVDDLTEVERDLTAAVALVRARTAAEEVLEGHQPDATALKTARRLDTHVATKRALLEAGVPRLTITATNRRAVALDGTDTQVGPDAEITTSIDVERTLTVDDVTAVIAPGTSAGELADAVATAETALADHLAEQHATSLETLAERVQAVAAARTDLERTDEDATRLAEVGGVDGLTTRAERLRERAAGAPDDLPTSDALTELVAERTAALERADVAVDDADEALEAATAAVNAAQAERAETTATLTGARGRLSGLQDTLAAARETADDTALAEAVTSTEAAVATSQARLAAAREQLEAANPEQADALLAAAEANRDNAEADLNTQREQRDVLKGRLQSSAADGVAERVTETAAAAEAARAAAARAQLEADAHARLLETLTRHRDAARERYLAPLKEQVELLGRRVYGASFSVDLDEELQVTSRTLDGVTVPFEDLSGGTREQIAVLTRIAAASLVSRDDGVPIILDDTLGFSDPQRLALFNSLLGVVDDRTQVVVLTCWPERFRQVPDQHRILLT